MPVVPIHRWSHIALPIMKGAVPWKIPNEVLECVAGMLSQLDIWRA